MTLEQAKQKYEKDVGVHKSAEQARVASYRQKYEVKVEEAKQRYRADGLA